MTKCSRCGAVLGDVDPKPLTVDRIGNWMLPVLLVLAGVSIYAVTRL